MFKHYLTDLYDQAAFKGVWAGLVSGSGWLLGGFEKVLLALLVLYLIDFGLGLYRAWKGHSLSRDKFCGGLKKLILYAFLIVSAQMLDVVLTVSVPDLPFLAGGVRGFIIGYAAVMEMLSICTHLHAEGVRLPLSLVKRLNGYRDKMDGISVCPEEKL